MNTRLHEDLRQADPERTLTEGLVSLIRSKPVSQDDLDVMALFTLDGIANILAGRRTEPGRILLSFLRETDAGRRALVMGGLCHILEVDDLHKASVVHPACVTIPAALALAKDLRPDGHELLKAILHGFETCTRIGMSVGKTHYRVWHNTATCGTFGGAMTAATLLRLPDETTVHALGNAGTQSAGLWQFLETGAMSKHLHAGRGAEAGLVSAQLAALGFTGPPAILEGVRGLYAGSCPDAEPEMVLKNPEMPWQVHATSVKPWPSCRHTHPVVDAALELSSRIDVNSITRIDAATYQAAIDVCDRHAPTSDYEAKFSLQHCIAICLTDGKCGFESFGPDARRRAADLAQKVILRPGDSYNLAYPGSWGGEVTAGLADGASITAMRTVCKGDPEAALSRDEMIEKAKTLLQYAGVDDPRGLISAVLDMADNGPVPDIVL